MKTTIYLIRHGTTDWNDAGRYQGSSDIPLNTKGLEEARTTAQLLSTVAFNAIYSSPLIRAQTTAEAIAQHHSLPIITIEDLRERSYGSFEGFTFSELESHAHFKNNKKGEWYIKGAPDGESFDNAVNRVSKALSGIVQKHPNETVGIVAHGGVIKSIGYHIGHLKKENMAKILIQNARPLIIEYIHIEKSYSVIDFPFLIKQ